jgi:hypothetical protein
MERNILSEEIKRMRLFTNYDSRKTLTENEIILNEQIGTFLKDLVKTDAAIERAAIRDLDAGFGAIKGGITDTKGIVLRDADEVMRAVKAGTLAPAELGKVNKVLFKNTTNSVVKQAIAKDLASSTTFATKYATKSEAEALLMLEAKGYTKSEAKMIVNEYKNSGKAFKGGKITKTKITKNRKPPVKPRPKNLKPIKGKPTMWQRFKTKIVGMTRGKIFKYLLAAGGLYLVWRWWMDEGSKPFPDCLSKNIPTEDLQKMGEEGLEYILITDTGNSAIDKNGGGKFFDDKKFVTGNDKYTGTWSDTDSGIVITINGTDYAMSCEGIVEEVTCPEGQSWDGEKCVPSGGDGGTTWTNCTSFPYKKGCKNDDIKKIQDCLGITSDGKFGSDTEKALKSKGYDVIITQEIYDKIMANCGGTTTTTTIYTPDRNEMGNNDLNK